MNEPAPAPPAGGEVLKSPPAAGEKPGSPRAGGDTPKSLEDVLIALPPRAGPAAEAAPALCAPASLADLFIAFTRLSLQGFGGVLPVAQRELVERLHWLTREQFVEMLAVSQVLPGPNVVNLSLMFGDRHFGLRGAFAALGGMLLVPMGVVLVLTAFYAEFAHVPAVGGALRGMGAVAAGLVIATGFKLLAALRKSALGLATGVGLAAAMALGSAWLHWPLVWLLVGLGLASCGVAWTRMRP